MCRIQVFPAHKPDTGFECKTWRTTVQVCSTITTIDALAAGWAGRQKIGQTLRNSKTAIWWSTIQSEF